MARIEWGDPKNRVFDAGVDRGVLYVEGQVGVAWTGLVSIEESSSGGDPQPRYQDGVRTHTYAPYLEVESTLTAYTYPEEFEECLGVKELTSGVMLDGQDRSPFALSYQTQTHDPLTGLSNRKIHLIYNAIATENARVHETLNDETTPTVFSWGIQTSAAISPGYRPSSHFTIDPSQMGPKQFEHICGILYGTETTDPSILYPTEIVDITNNWKVLYPSSITYPSTTTTPGGP